MATNNTTNIIRYGSRTFGEIKEDLISYIKQAYPEVINDFTDSSVGAMLIDINAGVSNNLSINTDRVFQETQLEYAQQKASILNIAKNMGFNIPPKRPSITVVDFTVTVPVLGDKPNPSYYPVLNVGAEIVGGGKVFQTLGAVDWNSPVSFLGDSNRSIIPVMSSNGTIASYSVTKREIVINGSTNIFRRSITDVDVKPFFSVTLPDNNVMEIESVILIEGNKQTADDSDFKNVNYKFFEVDYLAQQRVFVEKVNSSFTNDNTNNIKSGEWIDITKKFIKEYTANGYCKLTFGSGDSESEVIRETFLNAGVSNREFLDNFLNNTALGEQLKSGYTLFVKYRTGGGSSSNVGKNVLTQLGSYNLVVNGPIQLENQNVKRSLTVTNPIPAIGGNDGLSIEQIRNLIKYNYSSQNRDVTLNDYKIQVYKMPGKFGSPFRVNTLKENNKIIVSILGIGSDGKLSNESNSMLKENIAEYLSQYRMINDYIEVRDGKIFNLAFDVDVYVENVNDNQITNNIISIIRNYLNIQNIEMNNDVFLGKLQKLILDVPGVVNVIKIRVYNKVGGLYSPNAISQKILDVNTGEIDVINNTIYSREDSMFEIKYPEKDIKVYLRKKVE